MRLSLLVAASALCCGLAAAQGDPAPTDPATPPEGTPGEPAGSSPKDAPGTDTPLASDRIDDGKIFQGLTIEELEYVVKFTGYTYVRSPESTGYGLDITSSSGLKFSAYLGGCPSEGEKRCNAINLYSFPFLESANLSLKKLNDWNVKTWGAFGCIYKDGTSQVVMNLGADGGITTQWLVYRIQNFDYSLSSFSDLVAGKAPQ